MKTYKITDTIKLGITVVVLVVVGGALGVYFGLTLANAVREGLRWFR